MVNSSIFFKIISPIIILVIIEIIIVAKISSNIHEDNLYKETVKSATQTIKQFQETRSYYNENVVSKISANSNIKVDSNYKNSDTTIPLPATMIQDLSERLNKKYSGVEIKLYSNYPFPNRTDRVLDNFSKSSLEYFKNTASREPLIKRGKRDGVEVIRLAIADIMNSKSCVECHNTRADTPKNDWKLNDVRGVLEVIIPISSQIKSTNDVIKYINITIIILSLILIFIIILIVLHYTKREKFQKEQLKKEKEKLEKLVISFSKNVIASNCDLDGKITYVSRAFCAISGYFKDELIGKTHSKIYHPDIPQEFFDDLWETIKSEKIWKGNIKSKNKDSTAKDYWLKTIIKPEYNNNGKHIGYSAIHHDITAQKAKDEFFSNMSHELRTPLNSIIGFVNILDKKLNEIKDIEYIRYIGSSAHQLLELINDILDLAKIKNGDFDIVVSEFNAYKKLNNHINIFNGIIANKSITLKANISENLKYFFLGDWLRISQIILNIFSNAVKFTPENKSIIFDVDYIDGNMIIIITDTGIGMSQKVQDKIFKPFIQADETTAKKYGGTGLGLSITQSLIELMDGKLELNSQENMGTEFKVTIPIQKLTCDKNINNTKKIKDKREKLKGNILVAEDNKTNQLLIKILLEELGLTCDIAEDGKIALEMYDPDIYDFVLMDQNMPNMSGLDSMKNIRKKYKDRCGPIVVLTANVMEGDEIYFINEGMDAFLSKPIDEELFYNTLKKFLKVQKD